MKRFINALVLSLLLLPLFLQQGVIPSEAWDSVPADNSSHWLFARDAVNELYNENPNKYGQLKSLISDLKNGSVNESVHAQTRLLQSTFPEEYFLMAVGNNPANNHPEYYWQTALYHYRNFVLTDDEIELSLAYYYLGSLIHIIEDMSTPPHAYNAMHGGITGLDNFEILSFGNHDYDYYMKPDSGNHPGKNVLDVDNHGDGDELRIELKSGQNAWVELFETNLQAPAARRVRIVTDNPDGNPKFNLKLEYQKEVNVVSNWVAVETPEMSASDSYEWADNFAPNTPLRVSYRRPESELNRDVDFIVYVLESQDVMNEMQDPGFDHPWEYADWLRTWTIEHATSAAYWRRYWIDGQYAGDNENGEGLKFDITWTTAPNTERALLTMLDHATKEVVKWVLKSATTQFEALSMNPDSFSSEDAIGLDSYRVVLYEDTNYNSASEDSPEYIRSLSLGCTPYPDKPCEPLIINDLTWMAGKISSIEVRNALVTLYSGKDLTGYSREFTEDDPTLLDNNIDDIAQSATIRPWQGYKRGQYKPNLPESQVTGESHGCIKWDDLEFSMLRRSEISGVTFTNDEGNDEDRYMQDALVPILENLVPLARQDGLQIWVTDAWDSDCSGHGNNSTHYEGRGLDIVTGPNPQSPAKIGRMALLVEQAAELAGLRLSDNEVWIWAEPGKDANGNDDPSKDHVHVSVRGEHFGPHDFGAICNDENCLSHVKSISAEYSGAAVGEMILKWQGWSIGQNEFYNRSGVSGWGGIDCDKMADLLNSYTNRGWTCVRASTREEALRIAAFWLQWTSQNNENGLPFPVAIPMQSNLTSEPYGHWTAIQGYISTKSPTAEANVSNPAMGDYDVGGLFVVDPSVSENHTFVRRLATKYELAGNFSDLASDLIPNLGISYKPTGIGSTYELVVPAGCTQAGNSLDKVSALAATTNSTGMFCDSQYAIVSPSGAQPVTLGKQVKVIVLGPADPLNRITKAELKVTDSQGFTNYLTNYTPSYESPDGTVWEFNWTPGAPGATKYTLSAKAEFNPNEVTHCGTVEVQQTGNADNAAPMVQILQPGDNENFQKGAYVIKALAYDNHEVGSINVNVTGPESKLITGWTPCGAGCYEFKWSVNSDGNYMIEAKAIDSSGNEKIESVYISVGQVKPISISVNLTEGQLITKPYAIQFNVDGAVSSQNVMLSIRHGDKSEGGWHKAPPMQTYLWDPRVDGDYSVNIEIFDANYHSIGISKTVNVHVSRQDHIEIREGVWQNVTPSVSPPRTEFSPSEMVDTGKGVILYSSKELWKWDGSRWMNLTPSPRPASWPSDEFHQMAYDSDRDVLVLFGPSRHLWEYDMKTGSWADRTPNPLPSLWPDGNLGWFDNGFERRMVYDPIQKRVILVSSTNIHFWNGKEWTYVARNETWYWDGNSGTWQKIEAPVTNDVNRTIAFDKTRNVMVLYSINDDWSPSNDRIWELSGSTWQEVVDRYDTWTPLLTSPNLVDTTSGAYLIGGYDGHLPRPSTIRRELWKWDGQRWTRIYAMTGDMPETSYRAVSAAYDSMNNQLVLFTEESQTWIYTQGLQLSATPRLYTEDWPTGSGDYLGPGMKLTWTPSSDARAAYYRIEFSEDGGTTWQLLDDRPTSYDAYKDHHGNNVCGHGFNHCLKPLFEYTYRIRVLDANKSSITAWSNTVTAKSFDWPAYVDVVPDPLLSAYTSGSVVTMNLKDAHGPNLKLEWQIFPMSANVTYEVVSGCQNWYISDASANHCRIRISLISGTSTSGAEGSTKLAAPLMALDAIKVYAKGTDAWGYVSEDDVTLMLKNSPDPTDPTQETAFADVPPDYPEATYIQYLYDHGIVSGCAVVGDPQFCPNDPLTRVQQAVILVRAEHPDVTGYIPPDRESSRFIDVQEKMVVEAVDGSTEIQSTYYGMKWIGELDDLKLTAGCTADPPLFCPDMPVTRAMMATFAVKLLRGHDFVPVDPEVSPFDDVYLYDESGAVTWKARWVAQAVADNLVQKCGTDMERMLFFPDEPVTRAHMACMVYQALNTKEAR